MNEKMRFTNQTQIALASAMVQAKDSENKWVQLRSCTAHVKETENYYVLKSYDTVVAYIDKQSCVCHDVLRVVYGYTATSAQHISKFCRDYNARYHIAYEH